jgi:hypothetical protein
LASGNFQGETIELDNGKATIPTFKIAAVCMDTVPTVYPEVKFTDHSYGLISTMHRPVYQTEINFNGE